MMFLVIYEIYSRLFERKHHFENKSGIKKENGEKNDLQYFGKSR